MTTMLEMRTACEHCAKPLPHTATDAHICSYECTFCTTCVEGPLQHRCPNCGGDLSPRPTRQPKGN